MAQTRASGNDGAVTLPTGTHDAIINSWNLALALVVANVTGYADIVQRNRVGCVGISGSATGIPIYGASSTEPFGTSASGIVEADFVDGGSSFTFTMATGCSLAGTFAVSGVDLSSNKMGDAGITFNVVYGDAAAPTVTWATS